MLQKIYIIIKCRSSIKESKQISFRIFCFQRRYW